MRFNHFSIAVLLGLSFLVSCKPDVPETPVTPSIGKGVFVLNEGTFSFANASLTFYDSEADTVANNIFYRVNGSPLGDVGQSLFLMDNKLYVVVNNSNYIYRVDATSLKYEAKVDDFYSPRNMCVVAPNKAYVSDIIGTGLWIINPMDMSHCGFVETGKSTESMLQLGNELWVTNWSNYYQPTTTNNTVQVVDIQNDVKVAEIEVGVEPNSMVVDKNGMVWVLCSCGWETNHYQLCKINPMLKKVEKTYTIAGYYPSHLCINPSGTQLYFIDGNICRMSIDDETSFEPEFIVAEDRSFYNMTIDPSNGDIYVTDAKDYMQNGDVYRYSFDGVLLSNFTAGIIPSAMVLN